MRLLPCSLSVSLGVLSRTVCPVFAIGFLSENSVLFAKIVFIFSEVVTLIIVIILYFL